MNQQFIVAVKKDGMMSYDYRFETLEDVIAFLNGLSKTISDIGSISIQGYITDFQSYKETKKRNTP